MPVLRRDAHVFCDNRIDELHFDERAAVKSEPEVRPACGANRAINVRIEKTAP
jgi:hypothetical protein